jgi:hypothetical protein
VTGALDTKMRQVASTLISNYGKSATWTSITTVVPSPSTGTVSRTTTNYSVTISPPTAFDPASLRTRAQYEASDVTVSGEMYVMLAASDIAFTPAPNDQVTFDSKTWQVVGVQPLYSGSLIAAYSARLG